MKIDKTHFLLLTATIAAGACVVDNTTAGKGAGGSSSSSSSSGSSSGTTTSSSSSGSGGASSSSSSSGAGGGGCDDSVGAAVDCTKLGADCVPYCNAGKVNTKPKIAAGIYACLDALAGNCLGNGYQCVFNELKKACSDPTADAICTQAEAACPAPAPGEPSCHEMLDGMTPTARTDTLTCATAGCNFGLYSCAEGQGYVP